jgi:hypothetical protein
MTEPDQSDHNIEHTNNVGWLEQPKNINLMIAGLVAGCIALLLTEWLLSHRFHDKHHPPVFKTEEVFGYQAWIGFVSFVVVVALGSLLRRVIRRPEGYYDQ